MERNGDKLDFNDDEQRAATVPVSVSVTDAERVHGKVSAQLGAVLDRQLECATDPYRSSQSELHDLGERVVFLGGMLRQLDAIINPSPTAGVDEELRRMTE